MSIDVVQGRIAELQSALSAISNGSLPTGLSSSSTATVDPTSGLSFSDLLEAQNADLSTVLDQAGNGTLGSDPTSAVDGQLGTVLGSGSTGDTDPTAYTASSGPTGTDVVADAKRYLGVPYLWGGTDPSKGLDCSGLVQRVMKDVGVTMPRTVAQQRNVGTEVDSLADAKPGDLLVFGSHHIGIYLGNNKMLHAPHTGDHVRISDVYETPTRIRRVLPSGSGSADTAPVGDIRPLSLRQSTSGSGSSRFDALFTQATQKYNLPSGLLKAVASVESSFNPNAVSPAGAQGLMQLMPGTAKSLGVNAMNPTQAVDGAARMLSGLVKEFGSVKLAVAAYNAGPGAVKKYGGVPPYAETRSYVQKVILRMGS